MFEKWRRYISRLVLAVYFAINFLIISQTAHGAIPVTITSPTNGSVIKSSTVTVTGTTAPNYTLYLSMDGGPALATTADSFGNWSQTFTQLKSGSHSLAATVSGGPFAYFTNNQALGGGTSQNTVSVVDTSTNLKVNTINVGNMPGGIALSIDESKLYVSNFLDVSISIIDTNNDQVIGTIPVSAPGSDFLTGLVMNPNGQYLYAGFISFSSGYSYIKIISTSTNTVVGTSAALTTINAPTNAGPFGINITPDGTKLYTANLHDASLSIINVSGGGLTLTEDAASPIAIDGGTYEGGSDVVLYPGINPSGTRVYIAQFNNASSPFPYENNVYVLDIASNSLCTPGPCPGPSYPITDPTLHDSVSANVTPDGSKVLVSNTYFSSGAPFPGTVSVISTLTDTVTTSFPVGDSPTSIGFLGSNAYIANTGGTNVSVASTVSDSVIGNIANVPGAFTLGNFVGTKTTTQVIDFGSATGGGFSFEIPKGFGFGDNPIITNAMPQSVLPNLRDIPSSPIDSSLLGQLAQALKNTPTIVAYSFPYILFALLGLLLLILIWQTRQEIAKVLLLKRTLERERLIAQEKDDFLVISSHYLRTPAAIINLGIDELRRAAKVAPTTIVALSASSIIITNRVKKLTEDVTNNVFLKDIEEPDVKTETINAFSSPYFFLPILSVALLAILGNIAFASVGKISPSIVNFLTQMLTFVIVASLVYVFFRRKYLEKQQRENYEKTVQYQRILDNARNDFIENTRTDLQTEVEKMKEILSQAENKKQLKNIGNGVSRLSSMLKKFGILAQIESAQTKRISKETNLNQIIDEILEKRKADIDKKRLSVKITGERIVATTDKSKLYFVISSLIDNAIKFNKINGGIDINIHQGKEAISVTISDTGIGIKKADLAHIFKPFSRIGKALEFNYEGMGISLFINKIVMNYLGGDIMVESVQNKGTKTTVIFANVKKGEIPVNIKWQQAPSFG